MISAPQFISIFIFHLQKRDEEHYRTSLLIKKKSLPKKDLKKSPFVNCKKLGYSMDFSEFIHIHKC